jgi:hypothetical protein
VRQSAHQSRDAGGADYDLSPLEKLIAWRDSHGSGSG